MDDLICDHCGAKLHTQPKGGWYVGDDETAECPNNERGHTVDGAQR